MKITGKTGNAEKNPTLSYGDILKDPGIYRLINTDFNQIFYIVKDDVVIMYDVDSPDGLPNFIVWKKTEKPDKIYNVGGADFQRTPKGFRLEVCFEQTD